MITTVIIAIVCFAVGGGLSYMLFRYGPVSYTHLELLADFIRFGLVELVFHGHKFYFKLNKE